MQQAHNTAAPAGWLEHRGDLPGIFASAALQRRRLRIPEYGQTHLNIIMVAALRSRDHFFISASLRTRIVAAMASIGRPCAHRTHRRHVYAQEYRSMQAQIDVLRTWKRHAACMLCDKTGMCFVADCVCVTGCLQAMAWLLSWPQGCRIGRRPCAESRAIN